MTHFLLGFLTAIALISVTVIVWAVVVHRRQERQSQKMAAKWAEMIADRAFVEHMRPYLEQDHPNPQGKKGVH